MYMCIYTYTHTRMYVCVFKFEQERAVGLAHWVAILGASASWLASPAQPLCSLTLSLSLLLPASPP